MLLHLDQLSSPHSACNVMNSSPDREKAIAIAVNLLKHKSLRLTQVLKDLLTFFQNPNYTKEVLEAAVIKLIYTCPESAVWLFQHPEVLAPHIRAREIIAQELTQNLLNCGYTAADFCFMNDYSLEISEAFKSKLQSYQQEPLNQDIFALITLLLQQ